MFLKSIVAGGGTTHTHTHKQTNKLTNPQNVAKKDSLEFQFYKP